MPDLPEDRLAALRGLEPERPTVSAVEVRRRGERRRRTRHALSAAGAVLAVAVLAGGVSALAPGDDRSASDPVDTPTPSVTESSPLTIIPVDVPLDAGLPAENLDGSPVEVTQAPGVDPIEVCGEPLLTADGAIDVAGVSYSGGEDYRARTLILLDSEAGAGRLLTRTSEAIASCPRQAEEGSTLLIEPLESTLGTESVVFMTRFENAGSPLTGPTVYHLVRVANGVLITAQGGEAANTPEGLAAVADDAAGEAAEVLAALTAPAAAPETAPVATPATTDIPEDLSLAAGLPADGGDVEVSAPSADGDGMGVVDLCGAAVWPPSSGSVDRQVITASGPEYLDVRELQVFPNATVASAVLASVRAPAASCRRDDTQRWDLLQPDTGYDSLTLGLSYTDGLGAAVFQWTRVGAALLVVHVAGEGSRRGLQADADRVTTTTRTLAPALCPFTADGC